MTKARLEAFSDGVFAIIITIMVIELKAPHEATLHALVPLRHEFLSYLLSFAFIGIYWSNHHHMLQAVEQVNGRILWANLHLLFWLSLVPFVTSWIGKTEFGTWPVIAYGVDMLLAGFAYRMLTKVLISHHGEESRLAAAVGRDFKGNVSLILYVAAIVLAFVDPVVACGIYALVAIIWVIPDWRIEKVLNDRKPKSASEVQSPSADDGEPS
jgi:uncharacterized membrane protein